MKVAILESDYDVNLVGEVYDATKEFIGYYISGRQLHKAHPNHFADDDFQYFFREEWVTPNLERKVDMFTKDDLKDGQIVKLRDGRVDFVYGNGAASGTKNIVAGRHINHDLTCSAGSKYDIMEVYELSWRREEVTEMTMEEVNAALGKTVKIVESH